MDNFLTEAIRMYALTFVTILSIFILIVVYYPYVSLSLSSLTAES